MFLNNSGTARNYGCLSASFRRLERDTRCRRTLTSYWKSNAFSLSSSRFTLYLDRKLCYILHWCS